MGLGCVREFHIEPLTPERILRLEPDRVVFLDQRRLPAEEVELECRSAAEVAEAIRTLAVRGAPAIGIAAAYGYALAAAQGDDLAAAERVLRGSRPTAVNLGWALDVVREADDPAETARRTFEDGATATDLPRVTMARAELDKGVSVAQAAVAAGLTKSTS